MGMLTIFKEPGVFKIYSFRYEINIVYIAWLMLKMSSVRKGPIVSDKLQILKQIENMAKCSQRVMLLKKFGGN